MKFSELGLPEPLLRALSAQGIETPTPIQAQAIPHALAGRDLLASARTGTGKTLAFSLPMVMNLMRDPQGSALVLVPTRELASQVMDVLGPLLKGSPLGAPALLIGGVSFGPQVQALRRNPRVVVATPGRLIDLMNQGAWRGARLHTLVLDEADRMLDMGFGPQVKAVLRNFSGDRQTFLFSATYSKELKAIAKEFLDNPAEVFVDPPSSVTTTVDEKVIEVSVAGKQEALLDALNAREGRALIFARTKKRVDRLAHFLRQYGHDVDCIHGDRSQGQRQRALDSFRREDVRLLVATDIAARGLDIPLVPYVFNFDLPEAREDYVHRIGRTGRAGSSGEAVSFVTPEDAGQWKEVSGQAKAGSTGPRPYHLKRAEEQKKRQGARKGAGGGRGSRQGGEAGRGSSGSRGGPSASRAPAAPSRMGAGRGEGSRPGSHSRPESRGEGTGAPERGGRFERSERPLRAERSERSESFGRRPDRQEGRDRSASSERPARGERAERGERPARFGQGGGFSGGHRAGERAESRSPREHTRAGERGPQAPSRGTEGRPSGRSDRFGGGGKPERKGGGSSRFSGRGRS